jgi:hypothetical protein
LIAYYQFNEGTALTVDRIGSKHATLSKMTQSESTVPVGPGVTDLVIASNGTATATQSGVVLNWMPPAPVPPGRISVTRLDVMPYSAPVAGRIVDSSYYIIRAVDTETFTAPTSLTFNGITLQPDEAAGDLSLRLRPWNGEGIWGVASISAGTAADNGPGMGVARFDRPSVTFGAQLAIASTDVVSVTGDEPIVTAAVAPHPFTSTLIMTVSAPCTFEIVDLRGVIMHRGSMEQGATIDTSSWPIGMYAVRMVHGTDHSVHFVLKGE